ncbi:MAG: hypothetical protein FWE08_03720 [Oscillospiraceae bacterium]|nr:hypothetical protein [Oscillospiraceae bacterium]
MNIHKQIEYLVCQQIEYLVCQELAEARTKHGRRFNSPHEGYAVLLEEFEEMLDGANNIGEVLPYLWQDTKQDAPQASLCGWMPRIKADAINVAAEAIQVAAMAVKFSESFSREEGA